MKATGIVRRIDDLGRVVIPKEIRRTLKIREGMPMEIFTDSSGEVILKKYSAVGEMTQIAQAFVDTLVTLTGCAAVICDGEQVIAAGGSVKKDILQKPISRQIEEVLASKKPFVSTDEKTLLISSENTAAASAVQPVISLGDVMGAMMLIKNDKTMPRLTAEAAESLRAAAMFLGRQMED